MLAAYSGATDAYVYGPICVSAEERGKGFAQAMFAELQRLLPGREGILFIRRDNPASLRAHEKMGMHEVAGFVFDGTRLRCSLVRRSWKWRMTSRCGTHLIKRVPHVAFVTLQRAGTHVRTRNDLNPSQQKRPLGRDKLSTDAECWSYPQ